MLELDALPARSGAEASALVGGAQPVSRFSGRGRQQTLWIALSVAISLTEGLQHSGAFLSIESREALAAR